MSNSVVFNFRRNEGSDWISLTEAGKEFQAQDAANGNARSPMVTGGPVSCFFFLISAFYLTFSSLSDPPQYVDGEFTLMSPCVPTVVCGICNACNARRSIAVGEETNLLWGRESPILTHGPDPTLLHH